MIYAMLVALALGQGALAQSAMQWAQICPCVEGVTTCEKASDVTEAAKTRWPSICGSDKPVKPSPSPPPTPAPVTPPPTTPAVTTIDPAILAFLNGGKCTLGGSCLSDKDCCSIEKCFLTSYGRRLQNKKVKGVCQVVCKPEGAVCGGGKDCCGKLVCKNKKCAKPCIAEGAKCSPGSTCCGAAVCVKKTSGYNKKYVCEVPCVNVGDTCKKGDKCCKGFCAAGVPIPGFDPSLIPNICRVCVPKGTACDEDKPCCDKLVCKITEVKDFQTKKVTKVGSCVDPCLKIGEVCKSSEKCCSGKCYNGYCKEIKTYG